MAPESNVREPVSPGERKRLQRIFEHAKKAADQGNFPYANDLMSQCVVGDPANRIYVQELLGVLARQYNNSPKSVSKLAGVKSAGAKASVRKSSMQKDWPGVIKAGIEVLKVNPWDVGTLSMMAQACQELNLTESQLCFLKMALDVNQKDPDVNRLCGRALGRIGQFEQAISCWRRVEIAKPGDDEAQHAIADLTVEKVLHHGGYEEAQSATDVKHRKEEDTDGRQLTPEQQLEKKIAKQPGEVSLYNELADLHVRNERMEEAEQVLTKALAVSGGDTSIRERLEDVQLRRQRTQVLVAERKATTEKTPEAMQLAKDMKAEQNRVEIEIYRARVDRYPTNLGMKYELGTRLKRVKQYADAIQYLQLARADTKRKATVHLELGECFQALKKYPLALRNFEEALESISERDQETKKQILYAAGRLGLFIAIHDNTNNEKWLDSAEKHLNDLASLEFNYKDVPALLDKVSEMRNKG